MGASSSSALLVGPNQGRKWNGQWGYPAPIAGLNRTDDDFAGVDDPRLQIESAATGEISALNASPEQQHIRIETAAGAFFRTRLSIRLPTRSSRRWRGSVTKGEQRHLTVLFLRFGRVSSRNRGPSGP